MKFDDVVIDGPNFQDLHHKSIERYLLSCFKESNKGQKLDRITFKAAWEFLIWYFWYEGQRLDNYVSSEATPMRVVEMGFKQLIENLKIYTVDEFYNDNRLIYLISYDNFIKLCDSGVIDTFIKQTADLPFVAAKYNKDLELFFTMDFEE